MPHLWPHAPSNTCLGDFVEIWNSVICIRLIVWGFWWQVAYHSKEIEGMASTYANQPLVVKDDFGAVMDVLTKQLSLRWREWKEKRRDTLTLLICNYEFSLLLIYRFGDTELVWTSVEKYMKGGGRNRELCGLQAISRPKGLSWAVFWDWFFFCIHGSSVMTFNFVVKVWYISGMRTFFKIVW